MACCESSVEGVAIVPSGGGGGGGLSVCYDGDPTRCHPVIINHIKPSAQLATDVFNKTHLMKPEKSWTKKPGNIWMEKLQGCSVVSYDRNPTRCGDKTMKILQECAGIAVEVYNKTHPVKYILVEVVNATEYFSAGSMLHVKFTAKYMYESDTYAEEQDIWDDTPRTLHALVSITHNYVEFVEIDPPADLV